jgi:hypothetical protein
MTARSGNPETLQDITARIRARALGLPVPGETTHPPKHPKPLPDAPPPPPPHQETDP